MSRPSTSECFADLKVKLPMKKIFFSETLSQVGPQKIRKLKQRFASAQDFLAQAYRKDCRPYSTTVKLFINAVNWQGL